MPEPLRAESDELTADEILDALRESRRVVVQTELPDGVHEVTPHHDGMVSYCDIPTILHKHEDENGMRVCAPKMDYMKE